MGSSFVEFRGKGFWVSDTSLQVWLHFLVNEIDSHTDQAAWLSNLHDNWYGWATIDCVGCIVIGFDEIGTDDQKIGTLINLSEKALQRIIEYGASIPKEQLNALMPAHHVSWDEDSSTELYIKVARCFIRLLQAEIESTASTFYRDTCMHQ